LAALPPPNGDNTPASLSDSQKPILRRPQAPLIFQQGTA
jgi:hypothetical protein